MKKSIIILVILLLSINVSAQDTSYVNLGTVSVAGWTTVSYNDTVTDGTFTFISYAGFSASIGVTGTGLWPDNVTQSQNYTAASNQYTSVTISGNTHSAAKIWVHASRVNPGSVPTRLNSISVDGTAVDTINVIDNDSIYYLGAFYVGSSLVIRTDTVDGATFAHLNAVKVVFLDTLLPRYDYSQVSDTLVNHSNATTEAKELYDYLKYWYGKKLISGWTGQMIYNRYWRAADSCDAPSKIYAIDMTTYGRGWPYYWSNPLGRQIFGVQDNGQIDSAIAAYNRGSIITAHWHWHAPSAGFGNDTLGALGEVSGGDHLTPASTTFSLDSCLIPGSRQYNWLIADIDTIAYRLKQLQDANIPVLWRPLHEASGAWFWWGGGTAAQFSTLWHIMYDRFTNYHGLYNLVWVLGQAYPSMGWLVNANEVDITGFDHYPGGLNYTVPASSISLCREQYNHKKIVALGEVGPIPDIDATIAADKMYSYFLAWDTESMTQNSTVHLQSVYAEDSIITLYSNDAIPTESSSGSTGDSTFVDSLTFNFTNSTYRTHNDTNLIAANTTYTWDTINARATIEPYLTVTTLGLTNVPGYNDSVTVSGWFTDGGRIDAYFWNFDTTLHYDVEVIGTRNSADRWQYITVNGDSIKVNVYKADSCTAYFSDVQLQGDSIIVSANEYSSSYAYLSGIKIYAYEIDSLAVNHCDTTNFVLYDTVINAICPSYNGTVTINSISGGVSPYTYSWSNGDYDNSITALAGTYTVTITDQNGCDTTLSYTITAPTSISFNNIKTEPTCNGGNDGAIDLIVSGGTPLYILDSVYNWTTDESIYPDTISSDTFNVNGLSSGSITFYIHDTAQCMAGFSTSLTDPDAISVTDSTIDDDGTNSGEIYITVIGGTFPYTYLWSNGEITQNITGLSAAGYSVSITDNNGCTGSSGTITVSDLSEPSEPATTYPIVYNRDSDGNPIRWRDPVTGKVYVINPNSN